MIGSNIVESNDSGASHDVLSKLIDLAADPGESKKRIADLKQAEDNAKKALADLKIGTNLAEGLADLEVQREKAAGILDAAAQEAKTIIDQANQQVSDLRLEIRASSDAVALARAEVKEQRKAAESRWKSAESLAEAAEKEKAGYHAAKTEYENKLKTLKAKFAGLEL